MQDVIVVSDARVVRSLDLKRIRVRRAGSRLVEIEELTNSVNVTRFSLACVVLISQIMHAWTAFVIPVAVKRAHIIFYITVSLLLNSCITNCCNHVSNCRSSDNCSTTWVPILNCKRSTLKFSVEFTCTFLCDNLHSMDSFPSHV